MSSDHYGSIAGEIADEGAKTEAAFLEWLDAYTRRPAEGTYHDDLRAAFEAGADRGYAPDVLRRVARLVIGGNAPWLADELINLAGRLEREMSGISTYPGDDDDPEGRQSTTACCPRQTIPDSCSCPDGCSCLCRDCDCGTDCDCCRDEAGDD